MARAERKTRLPRKLLGALVIVELLSLPAAAQIVDRVRFSAPERVIVADLPNETEGMRSYLVASNTPFAVEVSGVVGEVDVEITTTGDIAGMSYGTHATSPGLASTCVQGRLAPIEAYRSERRTAATRGRVQDQAVRVDVSFDPLAEPAIQLVAASKSASPKGRSCERLAS